MLDIVPQHIISIIRAKTEHPVLASFRRDVKIAYSEELDCRILFDTGSAINFITTEALIKLKGCKINRVKTTCTVTFINDSQDTFDEMLLIDFPLSQNLTLRGLPFYEISQQKRFDILIGTSLLDYVVLHYTPNEIRLHLMIDSQKEPAMRLKPIRALFVNKVFLPLYLIVCSLLSPSNRVWRDFFLSLHLQRLNGKGSARCLGREAKMKNS